VDTQTTLSTNLTQYKAAGLSRFDIVSRLKEDMFNKIGAVAEATDGFFSNADERVGSPIELRITDSNLAAADTGTPVIKILSVDDGSDGAFRTYYTLRRA
jgi:hypothetical protein